MALHHSSLIELGMLVVLLGVTPLALLLLGWQWSDPLPGHRANGRWISRYSLMTVGVGLMVLAVVSSPVPAQEIFGLRSESGVEFYRVDSAIDEPALRLTSSETSRWPGLESNRKAHDFTFHDWRTKTSSLILDPGFRTSPSNRIITVSGRIDWVQPFEPIELIDPLREMDSLDIAQLNLARLTGIYETVWVSSHGFHIVEYY